MATLATTSKQALDHVLADYEIRLTAAGAAEQTPAPRDAVLPLPEIMRDADTPTDWPTDHRRVPPYRPIDYNLDPAERIVYNNGGERAFITVMFFGLRLITVSTACHMQSPQRRPMAVLSSPSMRSSLTDINLGDKQSLEIHWGSMEG
jgi:hypothetical protein